jgi:hypothetical protein
MEESARRKKTAQADHCISLQLALPGGYRVWKASYSAIFMPVDFTMSAHLPASVAMNAANGGAHDLRLDAEIG